MTDSPDPGSNWATFGLIAVAGAMGAMTRYGLDMAGLGGAVAVLVANVLGCLALGVVVTAVSPYDRRTRAVIAGGFLGSFTTYSALATTVLESTVVVGVGYLMATYALGLAAIWAGAETTRRLEGTWS